MMVPLGMEGPRSLFKPPKTSPLKGDIPNKYSLYKVYMGLIIAMFVQGPVTFFQGASSFWGPEKPFVFGEFYPPVTSISHPLGSWENHRLVERFS